jgi:hypothetical protein
VGRGEELELSIFDRVGVVMPVFNAFDDAVEALYRIRTRHIWTPYIMPQWKTNWPLAKAWNIGVGEAFEDGCDYALVINDDAFVESDTIDKLVVALSATELSLVSATERPGKDAVHFSCFMVGREIFERVGYFDENFKPIYFEDNDFIYRMRLLNVGSQGIDDAFFEHKGSRSLEIKREQGQGPQHDEEFRANQDYYVKKWGGQPGLETYRTPFNKNGSIKEWGIPEHEWTLP